jgi:hypothetical protein
MKLDQIFITLSLHIFRVFEIQIVSVSDDKKNNQEIIIKNHNKQSDALKIYDYHLY